MNWFIFALLTTISWGVADLFYKKGSDASDKYSHLKIVMAVGLVMGIHATIYMIVHRITPDPRWLLTYLPVSAMYILSMTLGYVGLKYIELSVSSPIQNSSGAVTTLLCFFILHDTVAPLQAVSIVLITAGVVLLAVFEKKGDDQARKLSGEKVEKKYTISFIAIIFPILYCIIDALGTFLDGIYLDSDNPIMTEDAALIAYEYTFLICAVLAFIFVRFIKKEKIRIPEQKDRLLAAVFETAGQFFYVFVIGDHAIVAAPMIASYSIVSIILSRIFLKEKLTKTQYAIIAAVMIGIAILGVYDG